MPADQAEKWVALDEDAVGLTLSRDVHDAAGRLLVSRGTQLDEQSIEHMRKRGVKKAEVEPTEDSACQSVKDSIERMFEGHLEDPYMSSLKEAALEQVEASRCPGEE